MRYDPDCLHYMFNTQQFLTCDEERSLIQGFREYRRQQRNEENAGQMTVNGNSIPAWKAVLSVIAFLALIVLLIVLFQSGHIAVGAAVFGGIFIAAGLAAAFSKPTEPSDSAMGQRLTGLMFAFVGVSITVPMLLMNVLGEARAFLLLGGGMFMSCGMLFCLDAALQFIRSRKSYGEPVQARCIGYVRRICSKQRGPSYLATSEVFEYEYNGEFYQAINGISARRDGLTAVGETVELRLKPSAPDAPYYAANSEASRKSVGLLLFSMIFVIVGIGITALSFFGNVESMQVKHTGSSTNLTASGKTPLTDDMVNQAVGDMESHWAVECYTVTDKMNDPEEGFMVELSYGVWQRATQNFYDAVEIGMRIYMIVNEDTGEIYTAYKCDSFEYVGSHPVHDYFDQYIEDWDEEE